MSYLVDTNVLSELAKVAPDAQVLAWLRSHEPRFYVSAITLGELRRGIERLDEGRRKISLQAWLVQLCGRLEGRILSFNRATAHVWGQLMAGWEKHGTVIPSLDGQIAATAHRHGLVLVTRNEADFRHSGVRLLNPFRQHPG